MMNQLETLADFVSGFQLEHAPAEVIAAAKACILDTVSAAMGATDNPMYQQIVQTYQCQDGRSNHPVSLWGTPFSMSTRNAAFCNAMAAHTLELDDVHTRSKTHIGTVVIPAAWSAAESRNQNGRKLLEAVICGYETMARIGMGFGVSSHRNKGWHVTGTAGTFGAAAACGKLSGFSTEQMTAAFGLAGTQSCSTWAFLTGHATNKILHPARAASSGMESCMLTEAGMKGSPFILDAADGGIFPMMSDQYDYDLVCKNLGSVYEILHVDKKPYPCCRSTHCAADAAIRLRNHDHIQVSDIDHVLVETYAVGVRQCGASAGSLNPVLPTEAKFSTPYAVACALLFGTVSLDDFTEKSIADPRRQALLSKIQVRENDEFTARYPAHWGCRMIVYKKDGSVCQTTVEDASGSISSPLTNAQLTTKAFTCCQKYDKLWIESILSDLLNLEQLGQLPCLGI